MRRLIVIASLCCAACAGTSTTPSGPTTPSTPLPPPATTWTGHLTDSIDGTAVSGATVNGSATSGADGTFTLTNAPANLTVERSGYWPRQARVSSEVDLLPQDKGFNLEFFDYVFRREHGGTVRWTSDPKVEVWTREYRCVTQPADGEFQCPQIIATETYAPNLWVNHAMSVATDDLSQYTGGALHATVTTVDDAPGTVRDADTYRAGMIVFAYVNREGKPARSSAACWQYALSGGGATMAAAYLQIQEGNRGRYPLTHEFAHALGFDHGTDGYAGVPLASIMGKQLDYPTAADILHGRVLYRRPAGNQSPDKDPAASAAARTGALTVVTVR